MRFNENNIQKLINYDYYHDAPDVEGFSTAILYFGGKAVNCR